jgi:hypothetical protein
VAARRWRTVHPGGTITYRDFAINPIPHFNAATGLARVVPPEQRSPAQRVSFALSIELINDIKQADTVLLGLPLYNYGPPSTIEAWVDHLIAPGVSIEAQTARIECVCPRRPCPNGMKMTPEVAPLESFHLVAGTGSGDSVVIQDMRMGCRKTSE